MDTLVVMSFSSVRIAATTEDTRACDVIRCAQFVSTGLSTSENVNAKLTSKWFSMSKIETITKQMQHSVDRDRLHESKTYGIVVVINLGGPPKMFTKY